VTAGSPPLAVERTNAWLKALRRIATRRDRKAANYLASSSWG
jgi:transposase